MGGSAQAEWPAVIMDGGEVGRDTASGGRRNGRPSCPWLRVVRSGDEPAARRPASSHPERTDVTVVVPVAEYRPALVLSLAAIAAADPPPREVVVVCDGADSSSAAASARIGARVLSTPQRRGAAAARNLGVEAATTDLVLFVDSDVVVRPDVVGRVSAYLRARPEVAAVFGSYDAVPSASGFIAQYKNLFHHYTHQHGSREAATFWTGCGAIRRDVFESVGGFDVRQRWLEDVELGYRLRAAGHRIHLDRTLQATHLKRWTFATMVHSDVMHRALPWTELIHRYRRLPNDLNLRISERVSVALLFVLAAAVAAAPWWRGAAVVVPAAAAFLAAVNGPFYRFLGRERGAAFALRAVPVHWLYLLYSGAVFGLGTAWYAVRPGRRARRQGSSDSDRSRSR